MGKHNGLAAGSFLRVKASANSAAVFFVPRCSRASVPIEKLAVMIKVAWRVEFPAGASGGVLL